MMNYKRIKKLGVLLLTMVLALTVAPGWSSAAKGSIVVEVNGSLVSFPDAKPFMDKSNRVQVPVRFVSEALGAEVSWNSQSKQVTVKMGEDTILLTLGKKAFTVNGQTKQMDTVAQEQQTRAFVPLRFVSEALGAKVIWYPDLYSVEILTGLAAEQPETSKGTTTPKDPWDEWKVSRSIEGETEKKETEGFSYYGSYKSGLAVNGHFEKGDGKEIIIIKPQVKFSRGNEDYNQQVKDLEEILLQKIDSKTVDSTIKYVKQKTKREDELESKEFSDDTYRIVVVSSYWDDIIVSVRYK